MLRVAGELEEAHEVNITPCIVSRGKVTSNQME